jgi:isopenicillin N synthase-like dioxygenase
MYLNEESPTQDELPHAPDPAAGLYVRSRVGATVKVSVPRDCLAFQTGEALELITRGRFRAVPHYVRGVKGSGGVARNTLAVFTRESLRSAASQVVLLNFPGVDYRAEFARNG